MTGPIHNDDGWMDLALVAGVARPSRLSLVPAPDWVADLAGVDDTTPIDLYPVDPTSQAACRPDDYYECGACRGLGENATTTDRDGNWLTSPCTDCGGVGSFVEPEAAPVVHDWQITHQGGAMYVECTGVGCRWVTGPFTFGGAAAAAGQNHIRSMR